MTILIKPFLYLIAFGPMAVLFASAIGLACWLLMMCVRAGAWLAIIKRAHYAETREGAMAAFAKSWRRE